MFLLSGSHGASYILNTDSWLAIKESLNFYKPYTLKGKLRKTILGYALFIVGTFLPSYCKSKDSIKKYLRENINADIDFNLDAESSVLISSTRDKVIVNHHGEYFHKFAFGNSFRNVQNEIVIYNLLQHSKEFQVARLRDLHINEQNTWCHFKLVNPTVNKRDRLKVINNLPEILVEFFNSSSITTSIKLSDYIDNLLKRFNRLKIEPMYSLGSYFARIQNEYNSEILPLGLVHRDFKPWNTLLSNKLLIFDFEEAITDGPPLEDLLNYYIDRPVRYQSASHVYNLIFSKDKIVEYNSYLSLLNINVHFEILIVIYIVERIIFWTLADDPVTARCYQNLLSHILNSKRH